MKVFLKKFWIGLLCSLVLIQGSTQTIQSVYAQEPEETVIQEPAGNGAETSSENPTEPDPIPIAEDPQEPSSPDMPQDVQTEQNPNAPPAENEITKTNEKLSEESDSDDEVEMETKTAKEVGDASSYFHAVITTNKDMYTSGETALVSVKYTIDTGEIHEGDYVFVNIPPTIATSSSFSVSSQHFSSVEDLGNGQYKLTFGPGAETAISGSMTIRVLTNTEQTVTDIITAGNTSKEITVIPGGSGDSGTGTFADEAIMKDGLGNNAGVSYGGYDYSGPNPAQIGLFDSSVDNVFTYRLFINRKNVSMTGVMVTDTLPDGMYFNGDSTGIVCYRIDPETMTSTGEIVSPVSVTIRGQRLSINLGDIDFPVEIQYEVFIPAQTSVYLKNHAEVSYTQDGSPHQESRDYIAQGNDYSAANGVKSVDKTVISDDPSDQWVTYSIRFWNENGFEAGEISLIDDLDDYVTFLYADANPYFSVTQDGGDPSILHISNVEPIPASTEIFVTFVCDFSRVPIGYTVQNTVGGNTTKTTKMAGTIAFNATKTINGTAPQGQTFAFGLYDENHNLLQTKNNNQDGFIQFDPLAYSQDDLGKTYVYYISEINPQDGAFVYDTSQYQVSVSVAQQADDSGQIPTAVSISKDGNAVDSIVFDNKTTEIETVSIHASKIWNDNENKNGSRPESITIVLLADDKIIDSMVISNRDGWTCSFEGLPKYDENDNHEIVYSVQEEEIEGYTSVVSGSSEEGFTITNTLSGKTSIPVKKQWVGTPSDSVTIKLLANGETIDTVQLDKGNEWQHIFENLDIYDPDGNKIEYTIEENAIDGYTTGISGNAENGFTITNTITGKVSVPVTKEWIGTKKDTVVIHLYADGVEIDSAQLTNDNGWQHTFTDLEEYKDGKRIVYTVEEEKIEGYTVVYSGDPSFGFVITNKENTTSKKTEKKKTGKEKPSKKQDPTSSKGTSTAAKDVDPLLNLTVALGAIVVLTILVKSKKANK